MRGAPLRCPYLYTIKKNKTVSRFLLLTNLLYEVIFYVNIKYNNDIEVMILKYYTKEWYKALQQQDYLENVRNFD